jgi:hypothetical protein
MCQNRCGANLQELRGVPGIKSAFIPTRASRPRVIQIGEDGELLELEDTREIVILAECSTKRHINSFLEVMKLPEVDKYR